MEQQIHTLNEQIAIMNAQYFDRSTEKLEMLLGQMKIFNETEMAAVEAIAEAAIKHVVIRSKKNMGQRRKI